MVSPGLCDPPGVRLLLCIAFSEPVVLALTLSLFGQDCYCPETTLVEVPVWPAPLGGSQASLACSLLDNGPFHVAHPRKPAESFCPPPVHFPFLPPPCPFPRGLPALLVTLGQLEGYQTGTQGSKDSGAS